MIWRNYSSRDLIVLINNVNLLSEKPLNVVLGFPTNVT